MSSPRMAAARCALALALFAGFVGGARAADEAVQDAFVCMEETQETCDRENRNMELFIQGRDALERGRETGDLGEARRIALELMERKDMRHGKALMKFIYVQVSLGVHRNFVEAYRWIEAEVAAGQTYQRLDLRWVQGKLAERMTAEQLAEAKRP